MLKKEERKGKYLRVLTRILSLTSTDVRVSSCPSRHSEIPQSVHTRASTAPAPPAHAMRPASGNSGLPYLSTRAARK